MRVTASPYYACSLPEVIYRIAVYLPGVLSFISSESNLECWSQKFSFCKSTLSRRMHDDWDDDDDDDDDVDEE